MKPKPEDQVTLESLNNQVEDMLSLCRKLIGEMEKARLSVPDYLRKYFERKEESNNE